MVGCRARVVSLNGMHHVSFWKSFKERRLFRIVAAYAAGGWVAVEVVDQLTDQGVVPALIYDLALIWYLCGFFGAVIVGWYHGEKGKQRATKIEIALLLGLLVLGVSASGRPIKHELARRAREAAAENALDLRRVAVLYLTDLTRGGGGEYLADAFTEGLIDELAGVRELDVVSANGVSRFRGRDAPYDVIAGELETGTIVDGTVEQVGNELRVSLRVIDGESGAAFPIAAGFEVPLDQLARAGEEVSDEAARLLREWLGEEVRLRRTRRGTESLTAWTLYHRGEKARKDAETAAANHDLEGMRASFDAADSLLALAQVADTSWLEVPVLRGYVAFRRSRLLPRSERPERVRLARDGLAHLTPVLDRDPNHARAVEVRGTLRYWEWLQDSRSPEEQKALLDSARADLERAVRLDPTLATAHASLAHLYLNASDLPAAVLAGRDAYEEDAYLENADLVVYRIFNGSYNLEQFVEAKRWCQVGQRRFPRDHRFSMCELLLMNTNELEPDPDRAWSLLARVDSLVPRHQAESEHLTGEMLVGGVLARAAMPDSARSVWLAARRKVTPEIDPNGWTYFLEAYVRTVAGDEDEAFDLLKRYAAMNPGTSFEHNWWWRPLRDHPRWREIATTAHH